MCVLACLGCGIVVDFVDVDQEVLFELILAANYMDVKALLDLCCAKVASMMKGKTAEQIRKTFNIVNDFTPEEEAAIIAENKSHDQHTQRTDGRFSSRWISVQTTHHLSCIPCCLCWTVGGRRSRKRSGTWTLCRA